jgi:hypothetical protein
VGANLGVRSGFTVHCRLDWVPIRDP